MKEIVGELWDSLYDPPMFIRCITTNGFVKKNGEAVMGRGCAKEAAARYRDIPGRLGWFLKTCGNIPAFIPLPELGSNVLDVSKLGIEAKELCGIMTFPVKHNWWEDADIDLIKKSAEILKVIAERDKNAAYILPRPGCGNGKLKWEDVKPVLEEVGLPDNVWVISK